MRDYTWTRFAVHYGANYMWRFNPKYDNKEDMRGRHFQFPKIWLIS